MGYETSKGLWQVEVVVGWWLKTLSASLPPVYIANGREFW